MAKEWARAFYASTEWETARHLALVRDGFTCQRCGGHAEEVHHKEELTKQNIKDPNVSLNPNNLESLCSACHKAITKLEHGKGHSVVNDRAIIFDCDGNPIESKHPPGHRSNFRDSQ